MKTSIVVMWTRFILYDKKKRNKYHRSIDRPTNTSLITSSNKVVVVMKREYTFFLKVCYRLSLDIVLVTMIFIWRLNIMG